MKLLFASAPGNHRHKCCECGQVWEHADAYGGSLEAHTCPTCGREPVRGMFDTAWAKYLGPDTADCIKTDADVWEGAESITYDGNDPEVRDYVAHFNQMCKAA